MVKPEDEAECAEVTDKATSGRHDVSEDGMFGKQIGVSGETCNVRANGAGFRSRIVLMRWKPWKSPEAKRRRGKAGRKEDV